MPKKIDTSKVACKAPSPPEDTHPETSHGAMDVAKLMAAMNWLALPVPLNTLALIPSKMLQTHTVVHKIQW